MKPLNRKNYGSIPHLSTSKLGTGDHYITEGQERILTKQARKGDVIYVTIKYDGSNVGVTKINGQLVAITRAGYTAESSQYTHHHDFAKWATTKQVELHALLNEGERAVFEWMGTAHGILYAIMDMAVLIDMFDANNNRLSFEEIFDRIDRLNDPFLIPEILHIGEAIAPEMFSLKLKSKLPFIWPIDGEEHEGVIYRVERNGKFDFMAKWVRKDFEAGYYLGSNTLNELYP